MKEVTNCRFGQRDRPAIRMMICAIKPRKKLHYKKARYPCNMPVKTNKRNVANKRGKLSTVLIQIDNITRKVCVPHAITS